MGKESGEVYEKIMVRMLPKDYQALEKEAKEKGILPRERGRGPPIALCVSLELLMMILKSDLTRETKVDEPTIEPVEEPEEVEKVRRYFESNPGTSVNKARQDLKMSWKRVNEIKQTFHP